MTVREFLYRKNRDRDEEPLFLAKNKREMWLWFGENDEKYDANIIRINASRLNFPVVLTDYLYEEDRTK